MQVHSLSSRTIDKHDIEDEVKKISQKHLLKFETAILKSTKQRADANKEGCNYRTVNYFPETLKDNFKMWSTKKASLLEFTSENPIDLMILGTDKSGKTGLIKALSGDDKLYSASSSKVNDILDISIDGSGIKCREVSYSYIKFWETYLADAKIVMVGKINS